MSRPRLLTGGLDRKFTRPGPLDVYRAGTADPAIMQAEDVFFGQLQLSNRTFRTTSAGRLDDVNALLVDLVPRDRRLDILEVGASSGMATAELSECLDAAGIEHRITAGDRVVEAVLLTFGTSAAVLWEDGGYPLVIQVGTRSIYLHRTGRIRFLTAALRFPLALLYLAARRLRFAPFEAPPAPGRICARRVGLTSRRLAHNPSVRIVQDDIERPLPHSETADVCRAANLLNRGYFTDGQIERMARNLFARLRDGGLLVVCRTSVERGETRNRGSVLRKSVGGAEIVARLNGGSEVEDVLLAAAAPTVSERLQLPSGRG